MKLNKTFGQFFLPGLNVFSRILFYCFLKNKIQLCIRFFFIRVVSFQEKVKMDYQELIENNDDLKAFFIEFPKKLHKLAKEVRNI